MGSMRIMRNIGFIVILIGVTLFIAGGVLEVNESEKYERIQKEYEKDFPNVQKLDRKISDENRFASWLMGFSQILVLFGIGLILYGIAAKQEEKEPPEDLSEPEIIE